MRVQNRKKENETLLTLFAIPKAFVGHTGIIQRNAITSWTLIKPKPEIILFGDERGTADIVSELDLVHIPYIELNECGTPLISSAFSLANRWATNEILGYVNSDVILLQNFTKVITNCRFRQFLVIGQRINLWIYEPINFLENGWEESLNQNIEERGVLHSHWGADYFVFRRGLWRDIPHFAVGRLMWDNWLIYDARNRGVPVIDASGTITVIHQNHSTRSDILLSDGSWNWENLEVQSNLALAGGFECGYNIHDSTWVLFRSGIFPALGQVYLQQRLNRLHGCTFRLKLLRFLIGGCIWVVKLIYGSKKSVS